MVMERKKLREAREAMSVQTGKHLSQQDVADTLGCSREAYSLWERGLSDPQEYWVNRLLRFFDKKDPKDLDIYVTIQITEGQIAMLQKILGNVNLDRREALELVSRVPALAALIDVLAEPQTSGIVKPPQFLSQCTAVISACWQLMNSGGYTNVESLLPEYIPTLQNLATQPKYQVEASSLLSQAKLMQIRLATRNHNFARRKALCLEAVDFGELSGDPFLHAATLYWYGDTYVYCYPQPEKAIGILNDGMKLLGNDAQLNKSKLYSNLAIAHAQNGNESLAIKMAEQARKVMPDYPERDPAYPYVDMIQGNLEKLEGRMYLALAEHLSGYAEKAYDTFKVAANKYTHQGGLCQVLLHQADAARITGNLDEFARCLEQGMLITKGKNRKHEAYKVLDKAPDEWKKEQKYQELAKMF
jgi:transcriptional regulator with XRE-family HTH domain